MTLHLVKLCVGVSSAADLRASIQSRVPGGATGGVRVAHVTRTLPTRASEILGAGSLYWVIKGHVCARQAVVDLVPFTDAEGTARCRIVLDAEVVDVAPVRRKMFQGWRYLEPGDAPPDLDAGGASGFAEMPESLRRELAGLGLL